MNKQTVKKIVGTALLLLMPFAIVAVTPAFSETPRVTQLIRISPVILNISLSPGKTYTYDITVENLLNVPLPVDAAFDSFDTNEEGEFLVTDEQNTIKTSPLLAWSKVDKAQVIIEPKTKHTVHLTVSIPEKVPVGGYYGMLFFTPRFPVYEGYRSLVSTKVGVLMLASVGVDDPFIAKARITDFKSSHWLFDKNPLSFDFRVQNDSLTHFSAKPVVKISSWGTKPTEYEIEEKIILPGKARRWHTELTHTDGFFPLQAVRLRVSTGNGNFVTRELYLIRFPWKATLTVLLFMLTVSVVIVRRKNIVRSIQILIFGK